MEAILKFNLPDDQLQFEEAINGNKYRYIIFELKEHLRQIIKYNSQGFSEDYVRACEETRDRICEMCQESSVTVD
jgi:hypothetical protein